MPFSPGKSWTRRRRRIVSGRHDVRCDLAKGIIRILEEKAVAEWTEREDVQKEKRRDWLRANGPAVALMF